MVILPVNANLLLSPPGEPGDVAAYVHWLNDKDIYDRTLMLPYPYTEADAHWFISHCRENELLHGKPVDFAIRLVTGELIGGCGYHNFHNMKPHQAEIGYWLAAPYRGQGIMPLVVETVCQYGNRELGLLRIEAPIYAFNTASQRVLEKCGFAEEGYLRKAYFKNEQYHDGKLFARIF